MTTYLPDRSRWSMTRREAITAIIQSFGLVGILGGSTYAILQKLAAMDVDPKLHAGTGTTEAITSLTTDIADSLTVRAPEAAPQLSVHDQARNAIETNKDPMGLWYLYHETIQKYCEKYNVPLDLAKAKFLMESGGNPCAVSNQTPLDANGAQIYTPMNTKARAIGYSQIWPLVHDPEIDYTNPENAIAKGVFVLAQYHGNRNWKDDADVRKTLKDYTTGPYNDYFGPDVAYHIDAIINLWRNPDSIKTYVTEGARDFRLAMLRWAVPPRSLFNEPTRFDRTTYDFWDVGQHSDVHTGWDFMRPQGTEVFPVLPGKVVWAGWFNNVRPYGTGWTVVIEHNYGDNNLYRVPIYTFYGHLDSIPSNVSVGTEIDSNTLIGYVGSTGASSGTHLHFDVRQEGTFNTHITNGEVHGTYDGGFYLHPATILPTNLHYFGSNDLADISEVQPTEQIKIAKMTRRSLLGIS